MKKRCAIVVMAVGSKYRKLYNLRESNIKQYANRCGADYSVITKVPDESFHRSLLAQKLLIPSRFFNYDLICMIDLDVIISNRAPNIFDVNKGFKGFSAAVDQRSSIGFQNTCNYVWRNQNIALETSETYFTTRGFVWNNNLTDSINGGVMLVDTKKVGPIFEDAYWSDLPDMPHEEAIAAYVSQSNGLFQALDARYNTQIIHELSAEYGPAFQASQTPQFYILRRIHGRAPNLCNRLLYPQSYKRFVSQQLKTQYILHFAGGYPFLGLSVCPT